MADNRKHQSHSSAIALTPKKVTPKIRFVDLWASYPSSHPVKGIDNQCAIKMSVALNGAGVNMNSFKGAFVREKGILLALRANELSSWLNRQHIAGIDISKDITGENWQDTIKDKKGIVFFIITGYVQGRQKIQQATTSTCGMEVD